MARWPSFLGSGPWTRLETPGPTGLTETAVYSLESHMLASLFTLPHVFLSSQQGPVDVYQIWRRVVGGDLRNRPGGKLEGRKGS